MQDVKTIKNTRDRLNKVGPGFCAMKWWHQTLYLHTGDNHSCYHPRPHHIPIHEIQADPAALHNTEHKKQQRKTMLEGGRPDECYYCWNIEDLEGDHISDRMIHSSSSFAINELESLGEKAWDENVNPRYLEVSFGNGCNYRCGYCCPQASTLWMDEIKKHGNYDLTYNQYGIDFLDWGTYYGPKDDNPYIEAFWKWWPSLRKDLWTLRITGGEPLMNPGSMQFFDLLEKEPAPQLEISINTNLGVTKNKMIKFFDRVQSLLEQKKIKSFSLYTSIEGWGEQAEYMRTGLKCDHWEENFKEALSRGFKIGIMCTYNVLCVATYQNFLKRVMHWRKEIGSQGLHQIQFDVPYLKEPPHWMLNILPRDFLMPHMDDTLKFIADNKDWFTDVEYEKFKRVRDYADQNPVDKEKIHQGRRDFYSFFKENDKRLGTDLLKTFPMYEDFYNQCKKVYNNYDK
jgi:organic radical activating enzyme